MTDMQDMYGSNEGEVDDSINKGNAQVSVSGAISTLSYEGMQLQVIDPALVMQMERRLFAMEHALKNLQTEVTNLKSNNMYRKNDIARLQRQLNSKIDRDL
jgi:hypothetical protein